MKQTILEIPLFKDVERSEVEQILECSKAMQMDYKKGSVILDYHRDDSKMGILLSGEALTVLTGLDGGRYILSKISARDSFGMAETLLDRPEDAACVVAKTECTALIFDGRKLVYGCSNGCQAHMQLMRNILQAQMESTRILERRVCHMSQHSMRKKMISYLVEQTTLSRSKEVVIPYKRQELADYLGVDRSALSAELSRMKRDGILEYEGNWFKLLTDNGEERVR